MSTPPRAWPSPNADADVATRLEFVFPAVIRASFVLFALTYTYAVVAYAMYCSTPLGAEPIGDLKDDSMVQRWVWTMGSPAVLGPWL